MSPLTAYLGKTDYHKDTAVREVLTPLTALAERYGGAVVGIMHLNKTEQQSAIYRVGGSISFMATARVSFLVAEHQGRRVFIPHKFNMGPKPSGRSFRIDDSGLHWDPDTVTLTPEQVLSPPRPGKPPAERDCAADFIRETLTDGPVAQEIIQTRAEDAGISRSNLYRAKVNLGVLSDERPDGYGRKVRVWHLPS